MQVGGRRPGGDGGQVGKRFVLQGDDRHVMAGSARGVEHQKGESAVPRDEPETHSLVREHFFLPPRRTPQDDAALRRADELDQVLHLGAGQRPIALDLPAARWSY